MGFAGPSDNLRQTLREATANAHDLLDGTMRAASGWSTLEDYAHFLSLQYAARVPVEAWLEASAPDDLCPPPQSTLIAEDLDQLGCKLPKPHARFEPKGVAHTGARRDDETARCEALGAAWVLAGSALGNRSILAEVRRTAQANGAKDWPTRFLGDPAMLEFWKRLRIELENGAEMEAVEVASLAASHVFEHFIEHAQAPPG